MAKTWKEQGRIETRRNRTQKPRHFFAALPRTQTNESWMDKARANYYARHKKHDTDTDVLRDALRLYDENPPPE